MTESNLIPVSVLTGFLGSGKTTLLNRLLKDPALANVLVMINEFGEIGIDHQLIQAVDAEMVVMSSGCLCCTIQSDLAKQLRLMAIKRVKGEVPEFTRIVLETTGLADPAPILHTLMQDPMLGAHYRLDGVITTVDAATGLATMDRQPEAVKQAAVADRLVITKTDLAPVEPVLERLARLNPGARVLVGAEATPANLFDAGLYNPATKSHDVRRWLNDVAVEKAHEDHHHHVGHDHGHGHHHDDHQDVNRHDARIRALCLTRDEPVDWDAFALWAESLATYKGEDLLRMKAVVNAKGRDKPIVVHGVQHLFHPPVELEAWPDEDRRTRIVLIVRDLDEEMLRSSLATCLASAS